MKTLLRDHCPSLAQSTKLLLLSVGIIAALPIWYLLAESAVRDPTLLRVFLVCIGYPVIVLAPLVIGILRQFLYY